MRYNKKAPRCEPNRRGNHEIITEKSYGHGIRDCTGDVRPDDHIRIVGKFAFVGSNVC